VNNSGPDTSLRIVPQPWPFSDPPDTAVFTTTQITRESKPILFVSHDTDGSWQFHWGGRINAAEAAVIGLSEVIASDPALVSLANLPLGWIAMRESESTPWVHSIAPEVTTEQTDA